MSVHVFWREFQGLQEKTVHNLQKLDGKDLDALCGTLVSDTFLILSYSGKKKLDNDFGHFAETHLKVNLRHQNTN